MATSYDSVVRRDDSLIMPPGVTLTSEAQYLPSELASDAMWIIRKERDAAEAKDIRNNHYKVVGDPSGHIEYNIYADITLELLPEAYWLDKE